MVLLNHRHKLLLSMAFISLFLITSFQIQSSSARVFSVNSTTQVGGNPLIIEKEVSSNVIKPGDTINVKITIKNLNNLPVYDVIMVENRFPSPAFNYTGLDTNSITFNKIGGLENRTIYYKINMLVPQQGNLTLLPTSVTYYFSSDLSKNPPQYVSFSQSVELHFVTQTIAPETLNNNLNLIFVSIILIFYSFMVFIEGIITKLK
ncbi:MAG: hypothetical protein ACFFD1_14550 [Candidatus Thorarchaeota archaeon]